MKSIKKITPELLFSLSAIFLMLLAFPFRLYNLNYNSAFNDEAIYIIVGLMGLFERDWWTYNASAWIPGIQYFYPSISALAYQLGGLEGSRFLNVLFSVFTVLIIFLLTSSIYQKVNRNKQITYSQILASSIAALIVGGSEISHYISRLATYDTPSFMFLFLGLLLLFETKSVSAGNRYFLASFFLSLSYLAKIITGLYLPLIAIYFYFQTKQIDPKNLTFYKRYFLLPLAIIFLIFIVLSFNSLLGYFNTQQSLSRANVSDIFSLVWQKTSAPLIFTFFGLIGLSIKKQFRLILVLVISASLIILFHLATVRTLSMDKHLFLFVSFLSIISGLGIANLISIFRPKKLAFIPMLIIFACLTNFWVTSLGKLNNYNNQWKNLSNLDEPLNELVKADDKILAESGSAVILETYYKNFPPNTSTFDWLEYRKKTGDKAYELAVRDGYFDLIQLESKENSKSEWNAHISDLVRSSMEKNYQLVFNTDGFEIYKRVY